MTGFTALLIFVILSLLLAMTYAGYRVPQIFLGNKRPTTGSAINRWMTRPF